MTQGLTTRILFVDDEAEALAALRFALEPQQNAWETAFAKSGYSALALLDASPFDVVVADMAMPGMDGGELLQKVRERHPQVIRMILAGKGEIETAVQRVPSAHQFLLKPCDSGTLRVAVGRATGLFYALSGSVLARVAGPVNELPSLPRTYSALQAALADPNISLDTVAGIIEQDISISAKTLQLVNSALFGVRREIVTVRTAVSYLGTRLLQNLTLSAEVFQAFSKLREIRGFDLEELFSHCQLTARIAGQLHGSPLMREAPVVAGLLHDVGKLVLAIRMPAEFEQALAQAASEQRPLHEVEMEIMGVTHAEVGGYLLGMWGLPSPVVEAVTHHHRPERVPHHSIDAIIAVHVADSLAQRFSEPPKEGSKKPETPINTEWLAERGMATQLQQWEEMAESTAQNFYEAAHA